MKLLIVNCLTILMASVCYSQDEEIMSDYRTSAGDFIAEGFVNYRSNSSKLQGDDQSSNNLFTVGADGIYMLDKNWGGGRRIRQLLHLNHRR